MRLRPITARATARVTAVAALTAGLTVAFVVTGTETASAASPALVTDPTTYVNPSVGNNGSGTTFPGASRPFGMVENSPDTSVGEYASYDYADASILGFSQVHLSGIGCQITGNIKIMPTLGDVTSTDLASNASTFSHDDEVERPGYYSVRLGTHDIKAELTATDRVGYDRFTYPSNTQSPKVMINVADGTGTVFDSHLTVVNPTTVRGWATGGNFCGESGTDRYTIYFSTTFSRPITSYSTWDGSGGTAQEGVRSGTGGTVLSFAPSDAPLATTTGVSYVSQDGATANRRAEAVDERGAPASFDKVVAAAHTDWRSELRRIRVSSSSQTDLATFYTALYHSLLHPSIGSDVDGRYRGFDGKPHRTTTGHDYYQMFSLWDTYRTQNQLVALLEPARASDVARSILAIAQQGGWVPRWALGQDETNVMSGDPVTPFVVTLYSRGLLDDDLANALFDQLWRNVTKVPPAEQQARGRDGNPSYLANGYIAYQDLGGVKYGDTRQAGSATLEYSYADCVLATMADGLGRAKQASTLRDHCDNFVNLWNTSLSSKGYTGFPQARDADGNWVGSSDPTDSTGFHEGTAWQYEWLAQQDPHTLFDLMGGADAAQQRLDTFFAMPSVLADPAKAAATDWVVGAYAYDNAFAFNPNNEPDLHAPWMYAWTTSPWKTSAVVRAARTLFTDSPTGMPGNDDLGETSSWVVFSMLGLFEAQPGSANFVVSAPMVDHSVITPAIGRPIRISAPGASSTTLQYVDTMSVNGRDNGGRSWISNHDLLRAKQLDFTLTTDPTSTTWGTTTADQPPALPTGHTPAVPATR